MNAEGDSRFAFSASIASLRFYLASAFGYGSAALRENPLFPVQGLNAR